MKIFFLTFFLILVLSKIVVSQNIPLCLDKSYNNNNNGSLNNYILTNDCSFVDNEEAYRKIEKLMKLAGLPMNFTICKAVKIQNAYATVDSVGTRLIVYDDDFLKKLDSDTLRIETTTALAHEIGHHLAAHTLFINDDNFKNSYTKYCLKDSPNFNEKKCKEEYLKFLKIQRGQELEADKFAGYIMYKYGAKLDQVTSIYYKITTNNDDNESTHPKLEDRLNAVKVGYELAELKTKANIKNIDIQEIKGSKIDFTINNFSRIERNKLISQIKEAASHDAMNYVSARSKFNFTYGENWVSYKYQNAILTYLGQKDNYNLIDGEDEYFELLRYAMILKDDRRVLYEPVTGLHFKNNILKILVFNMPESPKVVYSAPLKVDRISLEEIKTIFIEIYRNGIQTEIDKFYK